MRRLTVVVAFLVLLVAAPASGDTARRGSSQPDPTSSTTVVQVPTNDIVPKPNSGVAPSEPGDRGGALQIALLSLVVLAIVGVVAGLVRQSRRATRRG